VVKDSLQALHGKACTVAVSESLIGACLKPSALDYFQFLHNNA